MSETKTNVHAEWLRARAASPYFALARSGLLDSANAIERLDNSIRSLERERDAARAERDEAMLRLANQDDECVLLLKERDALREALRDLREECKKEGWLLHASKAPVMDRARAILGEKAK